MTPADNSGNGGSRQLRHRAETEAAAEADNIQPESSRKSAGTAIMATATLATLETAAAAPAATVTTAATATPKAAKSATDATADARTEAAECNINRWVCVFEEDFHLSRQH